MEYVLIRQRLLVRINRSDELSIVNCTFYVKLCTTLSGQHDINWGVRHSEPDIHGK